MDNTKKYEEMLGLIKKYTDCEVVKIFFGEEENNGEKYLYVAMESDLIVFYDMNDSNTFIIFKDLVSCADRFSAEKTEDGMVCIKFYVKMENNIE